MNKSVDKSHSTQTSTLNVEAIFHYRSKHHTMFSRLPNEVGGDQFYHFYFANEKQHRLNHLQISSTSQSDELAFMSLALVVPLSINVLDANGSNKRFSLSN